MAISYELTSERFVNNGIHVDADEMLTIQMRRALSKFLQNSTQLPTISKVLERLVLTRLHAHLLGSANFSQFQSSYSNGNSMGTALL